MTQRTSNVRHRAGRAPAVWMRAAGGVVLLVALAALSWLQFRPDGSEDASRSAPGSPATVRAILAEPETYIDDTVVVSGTIDQVVSDRIFAIRDPNLPDRGALLVVLTAAADQEPRSIDPSVAGDGSTELRVFGTLRRFDLSQVEPEAGIDLDDGTVQQYEGRPVLLADRFERVRS